MQAATISVVTVRVVPVPFLKWILPEQKSTLTLGKTGLVKEGVVSRKHNDKSRFYTFLDISNIDNC